MVTKAVSVIIPTFNREHCLMRALDSAIAQSYPIQEIIVVDDGSTDATEKLIQESYPSVTYIKQENHGVSAARNRGIKNSLGSWLAFLDSDDEWFPDKLEKQFMALEQQPEFKIIHSDEIWIRNGVQVNPKNKHEKSGGFIFEKCLPLCAISPSAVLIHRELFAELGMFDESLPACEDYDLWLRICSRYPVLYVKEKLLRKYGGHEDQLSKQHWGMDRFRIVALHRLLNEDALNESQKTAATEMLITKCKILISGAEKRGNEELLEQIRSILVVYQN